jgi:hypothetical protein
MNEPEQRDPSSELDRSQNNDAAVVPSKSAAPSQTQRKLFGRTLISVFREELNDLCANLEACSCRHVRCLRPNDDQAPLVFDDASMLRQCRYSGLLEATRIRRQGYAHRRTLRSFAARFALLLGTRQARRVARNVPAANAALACQYICQAAAAGGVQEEDASIGYTKVFLRERALIWFEDARTRVAAGIIAALLRGHQTRQQLMRRRVAVVKAQALVRGHSARIYVRELRAEIIATQERAAAEARFAEIRAAEEAAALAARELAEAAAAARLLSATVTLQSWWRRRAARMRSMVAAVRREQEQMRRRSRMQAPWQSAEEVVVLTSSTSPVVSPALSSRQCPDWFNMPSPAVTVVTEQCDPSSRNGSRHAAKDITNVEEPPRKQLPHSRSARQLKESKPKKQSGSVSHRGVASRSSGPVRTASPPRPLGSAKICGTGSGRLPPSPRSIRRSYRQEIARLLAQHRQLRRRLPQELRSLPAELMEAAHALGHNGPPVAPEVLARINDVLHTLKAALSKEPDAQSGHYTGPYYTMPEAWPAVTETRVLAPSGPSAPALLQRSPSVGVSNQFAFHAPPIEAVRGNLTPTRGCGSLRQSLSARYLHTLSQSPRAAGFLSPPTSARSAQHGSHTPIRGPATVIATTVSTPVTATPRQIFRTVRDSTPGTPVAASTTVPMWAWRPQATTATAAPAWSEVTCAQSVTVACPQSSSCRAPSPCKLDTARDQLRLAISALPTPSRSSCRSMKVRVVSPPPVPVVHATPSTVTVPVQAPMRDMSPPPVPDMSPTLSPASTPGVPPALKSSNSSSAFVFPMAQERAKAYNQAVRREPTAILPAEGEGKAPSSQPPETSVPTWQSVVVPNLVGREGPSRCSSPTV